MCTKPFSWAKNKGRLFFDGKSRGPLLARVALKTLLLWSIFFQQQKNDEDGLYSTREKKINELKR